MPRLEVLPFADEHLEDASTLLAARHVRHREAEPLLPSRYEATEPAREELAAVWNAEGVSGAIAFSNLRQYFTGRGIISREILA